MAFLFNGISSDNYFVVEKIERDLLPPISHILTEIPNKNGAIHQGSKLGVREFNVTIRMREDSVEDLNTKIRTVASWLRQKEAKPFELVKEEGLYYMAYLSGDTKLEEIVRVGKGTLTFICPDPIAFNKVENLVPLLNEVNQLNIEGTAETFPTLKFTVKRDITFLSYIGEGEKDVVVLGKAVEEDTQTAKPKEELIFDDDMESLTGFGWSVGGTQVDGGVPTGTMIASNQTFTYSDIGTGDKWHGPAIKKGLSETLDDWKVECWLKFDATKDPKMIARAELYCLDVNGVVIAKFALKDMYRDTANTVVEFRAGDLNKGQYIIKSWGSKRGVYNDFWGLISLKQVGKAYECYVTKIVNGKHTTRMFKRYYDVKDQYHTNKLAQIQLHIAGTGTSPMPANDRINFDRLKVWKVNTLNEPEEVPIIARAGDVIEVNRYTKEILINGEPSKQILDPVSKLFPIQGDSAITIYPSDAVTADLSYKSRWE